MAALKYWLWLTTAPALSNRAKLLLLEHFLSLIHISEPTRH